MKHALSSLVAWRWAVLILSLVALTQFTIEAVHAPTTLRSGLGWEAFFVGRPAAQSGPTRFVVDSIPPGSALTDLGGVPGDILQWDQPMGR